MKFHVNIQTRQVVVNETIEGENEEQIWRQARKEIEQRSPFLVRSAIKLMGDRSIWERITEYVNEKNGLQEPVPTNAREFIEMGVRSGYITRLE
ncbi:hypothetical protein [Deinococcus cellulosilyticus]|uniref:Uncharacterized protein n=1 Tax=Deinococcus cellulosilyticus (strain DSM 18568 / NBRC 106333 / KACC 11606 / 5516J-15) TaxID=1223518 RepID=A0A511N203_DEIC1|nr:hypothetical protein [Deinococcus cellulosilyticus]GEM46869.1 hypothetical protein DC3_25040 [Deinococcus cellulosilyticus NBRC 106333 = KACC 11606]